MSPAICATDEAFLKAKINPKNAKSRREERPVCVYKVVSPLLCSGRVRGGRESCLSRTAAWKQTSGDCNIIIKILTKVVEGSQ